MSKIVPVILSGGSGTRLWPLSRKMYPKQFLPLMGDETMFQDTLSRLSQPTDSDNKALPIGCPIVVCNDEHRFIVAKETPTLSAN